MGRSSDREIESPQPNGRAGKRRLEDGDGPTDDLLRGALACWPRRVDHRTTGQGAHGQAHPVILAGEGAMPHRVVHYPGGKPCFLYPVVDCERKP